MKLPKHKQQAGFSLIEMMTAMAIVLILFSLVSMILTRSIGTYRRETQRAGAMTSAKSALNLMTREVANAGYGLTSNGLIAADSDSKKLRFRANLENQDANTNAPNEDVTYYYDAVNERLMRFDSHTDSQASVSLNGVSELNFEYFDYNGGNPTPVQKTVPSANTGKIKITVVMRLDSVEGQTTAENVTFSSEIALRNSKYLLKLY